MKRLRLSDDLELPLDVVTQTVAILAKRRAGKSYTMRRLAEQLFLAGQQVVIVDPKGDQWGIRSAADGKGPGLPIVILGGEHGDKPIVPSAGEVVAKLVVVERVSVLLDLSPFRKHEVATFMTGFLEALYRLKAREAYRTPVMLVIDEADAVAPQKPQRGEERMLGAAEDIVRRGGQRGIGCVLVTQRSAVLNKNVLTQAQMLVALRTIAPQDLAAMDAWIQVHGTREQREALMASLPSLPVGDAWFWAPGWPTADGIFKRVHVLPIETFDSGATPKPGAKPIEPQAAASVDLETFERQMAETIERAQADDPKALRAQIAELRKQLAAKVEIREVEVVRESQLARLEKLAEKARVAIDTYLSAARAIEGIVARATHDKPQLVGTNGVHRAPAPRLAMAPIHQTPRPVAPTGDLSGPEQRILDATAWLEVTNQEQAQEQAAVAFLAGYTVGGGAFNNPRGRLHSRGLIEYRGGALALTDAGRALAAVPAAALTSAELHERVLARLPGPEARILRVLLDAFPQAVENDDLARRAGYEPGGGAFNNPRGRLRSLGLVTYPQKGVVAASSVLFPEVRR